MNAQYRLHEVPEGWPDAARWDSNLRDILRRLYVIKEVLAKVEHVLLDSDVGVAAARGHITSRSIRAVEQYVAQMWSHELCRFEAQAEAKRAERESKVVERGREVKQKVIEGPGERLRYVCGRIDFDED